LIEPVIVEYVSTAVVAPVGHAVNENRSPAVDAVDVPTAVNEPEETPVAVGVGVGSMTPDVAVKAVNG